MQLSTSSQLTLSKMRICTNHCPNYFSRLKLSLKTKSDTCVLGPSECSTHWWFAEYDADMVNAAARSVELPWSECATKCAVPAYLSPQGGERWLCRAISGAHISAKSSHALIGDHGVDSISILVSGCARSCLLS